MKSGTRNRRNGLPVAMTIGGSDNSAGAGIQTDLKTFSAHGCYGLTAVTCVVAEVPGHVYGVQAVGTSLLRKQIESCFEAFPVRAVKTGMLYSEPLVRAVAAGLQAAKQNADVRVVVDPVMIASSGDPLLRPGAIRLYWRSIFPLADLVTPNLDELAFLSGRSITTLGQMREAGRKLVNDTGVAFLCKGGHLRGKYAVDVLITPDSEMEFRAPYLPNAETHGTGCTLSASITAGLARGMALPDAVSLAKEFITNALKKAYRWGDTRALAVI